MPVLRNRFKQQLNPAVAKYVASVADDQAFVSADIEGSMAHCAMLARQGLITAEQSGKILQGLKLLKKSADEGTFQLNEEFEDVHMNVETHLQSLSGKDALRLHTARSRNDQVALDFRLFVLTQIDAMVVLLKKLQSAIVSKAAENATVVMPGYTHLQRAQPVFFSHALLAFYEMFQRDIERFVQAGGRTAVSPLGAGAQAGTSLPIDPAFTAEQLGLPSVFANSIDAVMDRDFAVEFLMASCLVATHLSQLAETLIIWNTSEFGFIQFCDSVTTSSSLMPQKKNPDPVELVRGNTGLVVGELVSLLVTLKALPLGYNRDLQCSKPPVIRVASELQSSLEVMAVVIDAISVKATAMQVAASDPQLMATDMVEYLVVKGVPFRQAHEAVAVAVQLSEDNNIPLYEMSVSDLKECCAEFEADVYDVFDAVKSALSKTSPGGTGKVADALKTVQTKIAGSCSQQKGAKS